MVYITWQKKNGWRGKKKKKLQRILDSIWVADLRRWSPWRCLVGLPHSQKPTSCVGVRQTDWNLPQSAALPSLTRRGWTSSDYFMRWKEQAARTSTGLWYTVSLFFFFFTGSCLDQESTRHAEENIDREERLTETSFIFFFFFFFWGKISQLGLILQAVSVLKPKGNFFFT